MGLDLKPFWALASNAQKLADLHLGKITIEQVISETGRQKHVVQAALWQWRRKHNFSTSSRKAKPTRHNGESNEKALRNLAREVDVNRVKQPVRLAGRLSIDYSRPYRGRPSMPYFELNRDNTVSFTVIFRMKTVVKQITGVNVPVTVIDLK